MYIYMFVCVRHLIGSSPVLVPCLAKVSLVSFWDC